MADVTHFVVISNQKKDVAINKDQVRKLPTRNFEVTFRSTVSKLGGSKSNRLVIVLNDQQMQELSKPNGSISSFDLINSTNPVGAESLAEKELLKQELEETQKKAELAHLNHELKAKEAQDEIAKLKAELAKAKAPKKRGTKKTPSAQDAVAVEEAKDDLPAEENPESDSAQS